MSIEDNNIEGINLPTAQELPKEDTWFFWSLKSAVQNSYNATPFSSLVDTAVDTWNYFTWTEDEKKEAGDTIDASTGWYVWAVKDVFNPNIWIELDEDEDKHANAIWWFQTDLNTTNVFHTLWLDDFWGTSWMNAGGLFWTDDIQFLKWDRLEVQNKFNEIDWEALPEHLQAKVDVHTTNYTADFKSELSKRIKAEIKDRKLLDDEAAIAARKVILSKEIQSELDSNYEDAVWELHKEIEDYKNIKKKIITDEYVEARKGETSLDTFNYNFSDNAAKRTGQYIETEIVEKKMEDIMLNIWWTPRLSWDDVFSDMIWKQRETLRRDYTYYYEQLALIKDPKRRAKMKGMMLPQIEAREKLFEWLITDYEVELTKLDTLVWVSKDDKQEIIEDWYNRVIDTLTQEEKQALLVRDWTDAVMSMYYNYDEAWRRFDQWVASFKEWDILWATKWINLAVMNGVQIWLEAIWALIWWAASGISSSTFKNDDYKKIFFDEYEMANVADNIWVKALKHIVYNIDDIWEIFAVGWVANKINYVWKWINVATKTLKNLSEWLRKARKTDLGKVSKLFNYSVDWWLTVSRVWLYWLKWATEWALINPMINRSLKITDTDANATADFLSDMFIEPFAYKWLAWLGVKEATQSSLAVDSAIKWNSLVQNTLSYLMWEVSPKEAVAAYMRDNPKLNSKEAYQLVRAARDTSYALFDKKLEETFQWVKDWSNKSAQDIYKIYSDAYNKLKTWWEKSEAVANKILTTNGWIFKIDNITTLNASYANEVDRAIQLVKQWNKNDIAIWNQLIEKKLSDVLKHIKWDTVFQEAKIKLSKEEQAIQTSKFTKKINNIRSITDLDRKQVELLWLMSDLTSLRNSNVNQAKRISANLTLLNPMTNQTLRINYDDLNKLLDFKWGKETFDSLFETWRITITDKNQSTLWADKKWTFSSVAVEDNLFNKLNQVSPELLKIFKGALSPQTWKKFWYIQWTTAYTYETIDLLKKELWNYEETIDWKTIVHEWIFGEDISYVDLKKTLASSKTSWTSSKLSRDSIAESMANSEWKIVVAFWEIEIKQWDKKWEKSLYIYVWAGKGLQKLWFDLAWWAAAYHEKWSEILIDILWQKTIKDGIDLARPLSNIIKYEEITNWSKLSFINKLLEEEEEVKWVKYTTKDKLEISNFIRNIFDDSKSESDMFSKYIFEVFATKVVRNFDLFKSVHKDLDKLKTKKWTDSLDIVKTIEDFNTVVNSISGNITIEKSAAKYKNQYDLSYFKKEAEAKYDELVIARTKAKQDIEVKLETLNKKLYIASEKPFITNQRRLLESKLDRASRIIDDKDVWTKKYVDSIYYNTYKRLYKSKVTQVTWMINKIEQKKNPNIKTQKQIWSKIMEKEAIIESIDSVDDALTKSNVPEVKVKELNTAKDKLKDRLNKLNKELNKIDSILEAEVKLIKGIDKMPAWLKTYLAKIMNQWEANIHWLYDMLSNKAVIDYLSNNPAAIDYILDKVSTVAKYREEWNDAWKWFKKIKLWLFWKDAIEFISKEELKKSFKHLIDWTLDYTIAKEENPYVKIVSTAISWAGNSEEIRWLELFKDIKNSFLKEWETSTATNLKEFYFDNTDFKAKIDSLGVSYKQWDKTKTWLAISNVEKLVGTSFVEFKQFINPFIKKIEYKLQYETWTMANMEAVNNALFTNKMYSEIFTKFKNFDNLTNDWVIWKRVQDWRTKQWYPKFKFVKDTWAIVEEKLFDKELKESWLDNFRTVNINKVDHLKYLNITNQWWKKSNINSILRDKLETKQSKKENYSVATDTLKEVFKYTNEPEIKWDTVFNANREQIRAQLWLEEWEFIMWTYWDKETSIQIYKAEGKTFTEAEIEFTNKYKEAGWFKTEDWFVSISDIVKRESALASTRKMFWDVNLETTTLVIWEEMHTQKVWSRVISSDSIIDSLEIKIKESDSIIDHEFLDNSDIMEDILLLDPEFNKDFYLDKKLSDLQNWLDTTFGTDLFDGTSYISDELAKLADYIANWREIPSDLARKFHYTWTINEKRFLAKTLFNRWDIKYQSKEGNTLPLKNWVLIGENSVKLWEYTKSNISHVTVNWRRFKVIWEIKWTNTTHFKDAASDAQVVKEDQALSEQIVNLMDYGVMTAYKSEVLKEINVLYKNTMQSLWLHNEELSSFWDVNIMLNNLSDISSLGWTSDSMINAKLKNFLDWYKDIVSGNRDRWASHTILHSMTTISTKHQAKWSSKGDNFLYVSDTHLKDNWLEGKRTLNKNEIIVSNTSHIYKAAVEETDIQIDKLTKEIEDETILAEWEITNLIEKKMSKLVFLQERKDKNEYYVTWIRNPIPNRENLWVYKIVTAEALWLNNTSRTYVKTDDVILHPEATYMKLQWDNDGDHFVMFPIASNKSELVARTAYWYWMEEDLYKSITSGKTNDFAIIDQAEKWDAVDQTLMENRLKNLEAKLTISTWASVIRWINILLQYMWWMKDKKSTNSILNTKIDIKTWQYETKPVTLRHVLDNVRTLLWLPTAKTAWDYSSIFTKSDNYWSEAWSVLQLIMDFAKDKSWKPFPRDKWISQLFNAVWIKNQVGLNWKKLKWLEVEQYLFNNILAPLWASHKWLDKKITLAWLTEFKEKDLNWSMWYRRDMYEVFSKTYTQDVLRLKKNTEVWFILNRMQWVFDNWNETEKVFNQVITLLKWPKGNWTLFTTRWTRQKTNKLFDDLLLREDADDKLLFDTRKIIKDFDDLILKYTNAESNRIDYAKVFKEMKINWEDIITSKWELTKWIDKQRDILALYSINKWNYTMFSLLTDIEKIDALQYAQWVRFKAWKDSIVKHNINAKPTIILSKDVTNTVKIKELKEEKLKLESSRDELINEINNYDWDQLIWQQQLLDFENSLIENISDINTDLNKIEKSTDWLASQTLENENMILESIDEFEEWINNLEDYIKSLQTDIWKIEAVDTLVKEFWEDFKDLDIPDDYISKLNITYDIWWKPFKKLTDDFKKMADLETLLKKWTKLKFFWLMMAYAPDITNKVIKNRDTNIRLWQESLELLQVIRSDLEKGLVKIWTEKWLALASVEKINARIKLNLTKVWESYVFNWENYLTKLNESLNKKDLYNEEEIKLINEAWEKFVKQVVPFIEDWLTNMNVYYKDDGWFWFNEYPSNLWSSFLEDVLWSFKWDFEFEFRRRWIITETWSSKDLFGWPRKQFRDYMVKSAKAEWLKEWFSDTKVKIDNKHIDTLYKIFFIRREDSKLIWLIKEVQAWYYMWGYQSLSLALWGMWHISWITQILWNTLEMMWFLKRADAWKLSEATKAIEHYNLHAEQASLHWASTLEQWLRDTLSANAQAQISKWIQHIVWKWLDILWTKDPLVRRSLKNIVDASISEPLLATDMLQDTVRKQAAMMVMMDRYWVKNFEELTEKLSTTRERDTFMSLFYNEHNEMWGWVISNMTLFRETTTTHMFSDKPMWIWYWSRIFFQLQKFLNWWSFHKFNTWVERSLTWYQSVRAFMQWDLRTAHTLWKEFIDYYTSLLLNVWMAAWLAAKIDKYDNNDYDNKTDVNEFINSVVNQFAAMEILFARELWNLSWLEWEDFSTKIHVTMIDMLKHMTRVFRNNPFNFIKVSGTAENRREQLDEWYMISYYRAMKSMVGSYMRNAHWMAMWSLYDWMKWQDKLSLLWFWAPTNYQSSLEEWREANKIWKISSLWLSNSTIDVFFSVFTDKYLWNEAMERGRDKILADKNVQDLYEYWIWGQWYNLDNILVNWDKLDEVYTESLWDNMISYQWVWQVLDDKWRKKLLKWKELYNNKMDDIITNALLDMWYTREDFEKRPSKRTVALQKLFYEVKQSNIPELSVPHVTAYIANARLSAVKKQWKEDNNLWYKTWYSFESEETAMFKYQVIKELANDWILDANILNVRHVLDKHVEKNMPELHEQLQEAWANWWLRDYMSALAISNRNLKEWETNAKVLTWEYTKAFKWFLNYYNLQWKKVKPSAEAVRLVHWAIMNNIKSIVNSWADAKTQTTKISAALSGMNDSTWDIMRDDEVFNLLTMPAQKQLISWIYKTNVAIDDLDADSISNYAMNNSSWSWKSKYFPNFYKKWMSSQFAWWARPWFSKQFPEMREFLKWKSIPQHYKQIANSWLPTNRMELNYLQFPLIRAMNQYFINESFRVITQPAKAKVYIKKGSAKVWSVRATKKKISLPKYRKTFTGGKSVTRKTTVKWLPWDITSN